MANEQFRRETKYQWARLHRSGRTLAEIKALTKGASVGLTNDYANQGQVDDLDRIQTGLERLTMTRIDARKLMFDKFFKKSSAVGMRQEDKLATFFVTGRAGGINWSRDGNLVRRGPPNKPQPGSSVNVPFGRTTIKGERKLLNDWRKLFRAWNKFGKLEKNMMKNQIKKAASSIRASVKG
ncbi:MAG: hypothetical protein CBB97_25515 [Candidatus Endolissoclinum sp. TMED37]|nr:MAG: hypothetical protein CBB97_25515 [Candidatus Endolissoclinum sp. TMED37]|tara:strand:+ start:1873 stop:2415 length:543 start_codon:yes stop_codon:yes gene_type:complete